MNAFWKNWRRRYARVRPFKGAVAYCLAYWDQVRLARRLSFLRDFSRDRQTAASLLADPYARYTREISHPSIAISFELACFLYFWCLHTRPRFILDLGSGFSDYVFGLYRRRENNNCTLWTVDTDADWLGKTRRFLGPELSCDRYFLWSDLLKEPLPIFDVVLMDLGGGLPFRAQALEHLLGRTADGTPHFFLDDIHKPHYRVLVEPLLRRFQLEVYDLRLFTRDRFGRYSWLAMSPKGTREAMRFGRPPTSSTPPSDPS